MNTEKALETYRDHLPELLKDQGKFVLIHDAEIIDVFGTYEDALKEGYKLFSLGGFFVKQIQAVEQIHYITRLS